MSIFAVGSYTNHASPDIDARGAGITIFQQDDETEHIEIMDVNSELRNPSYLDWDSLSRRLYAVSEVGDKQGVVASYAVDEAWKMTYRGQREGPGRSACHLKALPESNFIFAVSYSGGTLTSYELSSGDVGPVLFNCQYEGSGPNRERQGSPHAHQVSRSPYSRHLYVCDLGSDVIWLHALDNPKADPLPALEIPAGYGPRHLAYDSVESVAYILCELVPRLLQVRIDPASGLMRITQEIDTVAAERMGIAAPAAVKLHPSGRALAVSNRFDDTITVFAIDRESGRLRYLDRFPCGGKTPRDIEFDPSGRMLFIANQDSHEISRRHFDPVTGAPGRDRAPALEIGSPVCILMLE